jgi:hypothetical protein
MRAARKAGGLLKVMEKAKGAREAGTNRGATRSNSVCSGLKSFTHASHVPLDCFWVFAMVMLVLVPVVFVMKRSVAEKGAHAGLE